jgi:D-3-phosphoglycerate dehydrogenase / 2-oxoglutarate reductase
MGKVFIADTITEDALSELTQYLDVHVETGLSEQELCQKIVGYDALMVRSATTVTKAVIEAADQLKVIGRAGVGVDNIDVGAATARGIMVINSPQGNTISAAEHTFALILSAARRIPQACATMADGKWDRKKFTGNELYNKTLGIVGFGRIGREVASRAASFKMNVLAYDPFVSDEAIRATGAEPRELDDLLPHADFVTLHVPKVKETAGLFDKARLLTMKKGAFLVNCARGGIVDEQALLEVLETHLGGAAFDVFETEPLPVDSPLRGIHNLVTTPHLAASTEEAQLRVAIDVAEQIRDVLAGKSPRSAVNLSYVPPKVLRELKPYVALCERMGCWLYSLLGGKVKAIEAVYRGKLSEFDLGLLTKAAVKGVLACGSPETVNFVNAQIVAEERGVEVRETKSASSSVYSSVVDLKLETDKGTMTVTGAIFEDDQPRVVAIDSLRLSVILSGHKLVTWQTDEPGVVGRVGSLLGEEGVNIAEMQVGRAAPRTNAVMVMSIDDVPSASAQERVAGLAGIEKARFVTL